jgi:hypothetical protein
VRRTTRLTQYEYKERTFRVTKESTPEGVLVKAQKWLSSQSSKAAVKVEDENGKAVAFRSRGAYGDLTAWHLTGVARDWRVP